jgi:hypothetical protein
MNDEVGYWITDFEAIAVKVAGFLEEVSGFWRNVAWKIAPIQKRAQLWSSQFKKLPNPIRNFMKIRLGKFANEK